MLGTPPAFILSQDQTLIFKRLSKIKFHLALSVCFTDVLFTQSSALKIFYLEFSGLFYCSVINVHFASKTLYSLASSAVLMTYFVCVSEIYIITLALTCQALFYIILKFFESSLSRYIQNFSKSFAAISICFRSNR